MSTRVPSLRALAERLRDPLWLPVLSAIFAFLAFEAASLGSGETVLVARQNLSAGQLLVKADVRAVRWPAHLPGPALTTPAGRLRVSVAAGFPLLRSAVATAAEGATVPSQVVGIPAGSLLSAAPLSAGETVSVYVAQTGEPLERLVRSAQVAAGSSGGAIALEVSASDLPALLAGLSAGHLIITATPQE